MQAPRPGAASTSSRTHKMRSNSPLDPPRSPLVSTSKLHNQLAGMSLVSASPAKMGGLSRPTHRKSKSSTSSAVLSGAAARQTSQSPVRPSLAGKHGSSKSISDVRSARTSPVKAGTVKTGHGASSSTSKTPSKSASLSKSVGGQSINSLKDRDVVTAGGLGRMDIVGKDWDNRSSGSAGSSPQKKKLGASTKSYDRFIPSRENSYNSGGAIEHTGHTLKGASNLDDSFEEGDSKASDPDAAAADGGFDDSPPPTPHRQDNNNNTSDQAHTAELSSSLGIELGRRILSFSAEPPPASNEHSSLLAAYARGESSLRTNGHQTALAASQRRRIATTAERVLDAPGLVDDYYLNLLDWSATNLVAIALAESVYIWNAESGEVSCLCSINNGDEESDEIVCSVKFSEDGSYLAIGTSSGPIQIYDLSTSTRIRTMTGHSTRVPTLSWSGAVLSSGSRDGSIANSDVRVAQHRIAEMRGHRAEVCGLAWRKDTGLSASAGVGLGGGSAGGMGLLASGGNDNVVNVWDGRMLSAPKMVKNNHTAAVKAIAWCPWQSSLLATGGGSSDRTIHFWNTTTSARLNSLVTPSQVTSLIFNPHSREILSSHGFPDNQLSIWSFPTLTKVVDITQAHETRVLHSCLSPDGTTVATASSDENLKFWKVFDLPKKTASGAASGGMPFAGKGSALGGEPKNEHDIGRRGRTGINIR